MLSAPLPLPPLSYQTWDSHEVPLLGGERPRLLVLWASWCQPCLIELQQLGTPANVQRLQRAGVDVTAVSVDSLTAASNSPTSAANLPQLLAGVGFAWPAGVATAELLDKLQIVHNQLFDRHRPLPVPCSFLIDTDGALAAIYQGSVGVDRVLEDAALLSLDPDVTSTTIGPPGGSLVRSGRAATTLRAGLGLVGSG